MCSGTSGNSFPLWERILAGVFCAHAVLSCVGGEPWHSPVPAAPRALPKEARLCWPPQSSRTHEQCLVFWAALENVGASAWINLFPSQEAGREQWPLPAKLQPLLPFTHPPTLGGGRRWIMPDPMRAFKTGRAQASPLGKPLRTVGSERMNQPPSSPG